MYRSIFAALLFWAFTYYSAYGQITIGRADMPSVGEQFIYTTSQDSIDLGLTGANMSWDFSYIKDVAQDTARFMNPKEIHPMLQLTFSGQAGTKIPSPIPMFQDYYSFFKSSPTIYQQTGTSLTIPMLGFPAVNAFTEPDVRYYFPLAYGDSFTGSFQGTLSLQGLTSTISGQRSTMVDGWGTIKTPYKTYNCIRVRSVVQETDSFGMVSLPQSRTEYRWLASGEGIPVMEVIVPDGASVQQYTVNYKDKYKNIVNPDGPEVNFKASGTSVFTLDTVDLLNLTKGGLLNEWYISPASFQYVDGSNYNSSNPRVIFKKAGKYTIGLKATNLQGSNSLAKTNYITVKDPPLPKAEFRASSRQVQTYEPLQLQDMSTNGPKIWYWEFSPSNEVYLNGTGPGWPTPVVMFTHAGKFTVSLQVANGGGSAFEEKEEYITVEGESSVFEAEAALQISVYPNPAKNILNIQPAPATQLKELVITDISGKQYYHDKGNGYKGHYQIDVSSWPKGMYIIQLQTASGRFTTRFAH